MYTAYCVFDCPHFQGLRQQHAGIFRVLMMPTNELAMRLLLAVAITLGTCAEGRL